MKPFGKFASPLDPHAHKLSDQAVMEVLKGHEDYEFVEENPVMSNDTVAVVKNLSKWPDGFSNGAIRGVTRTGKFVLFYGRWVEGNTVSGVFLLRGERAEKSWTRTSEIEVVPGRKYSDNLDTSHLKAMQSREGIALELLNMYALMGRERVKGQYACAATVSTPMDSKGVVSRTKDPIQFMIVRMPKGLVKVPKPGHWYADAPLVIRRDLLLTLAEKTGLNLESKKARVGTKLSDVYHLVGSVNRMTYLKVINELSERKWTGNFCLLGFSIKTIDEKHWDEITYDKVTTVLPNRGWCRPDGSQSHWDFNSQIVFCEDEERWTKELTIEVEVKENCGSRVYFEGNTSNTSY